MKTAIVENTYGYRNALLKELGYNSYNHYRKSILWEGIKKRVLERDKHRCMVCEVKPSFCVHHLRYSKETLLGEDDSVLIAICSRCHYLLEFDKDGKKRTLRGSQIAYRKLRNGVKSKERGNTPKKVKKAKKKRDNRWVKGGHKHKKKVKKHKAYTRCVRCKTNWAKKGSTSCRPCIALFKREWHNANYLRARG